MFMVFRRLFLFILVAALSGLTVHAETAAKYALLIGINDYSSVPALSSLDGTLNDLELTRQVLLQQRFGFSADNMVVLINQAATHSGIRQAMEAMVDKVKASPGGVVYIHYSGHGSRTRNMHPAEEEAFDQTWVSYGARSGHSSGLDQWDILDDELRQWLANIGDYADQVIVVSDSCHSGSITRGKHPATIRAAMTDKREHPLGLTSFRTDMTPQGVFISAAGDAEQAGEYIPDDESYGLFTWFWVQSLESASPGETWHDLLRKTRIQVRGERRQQTPQISGSLTNAPVFSGTVAGQSHHFPVTAVTRDGRTATIAHGTITGATVGSTYTLYAASEHSGNSLPTFKLTDCTLFSCKGKVTRGSLRQGRDLVIETQHAYTISPITLSVDGDFAASGDTAVSDLQDIIRREPIPGYRLVEAGQPRTMTLYLTRPQRDKDNSYQKQADNVLPLSSPDSPAEIWLLDGTNHLWHHDFKFPVDDIAAVWPSVRAALLKIARAKEVKRLTAVEPSTLAVEVSLWRPDRQCRAGEDCLKDREGVFRRAAKCSFKDLATLNLKEGDSLTFSMTNVGEQDMYTYVLNIGPNDNIIVLYPDRSRHNDEDTILGSKRRNVIDTRSAGRLVLSSGSETIKIITSTQPIAVNGFAQESYTGEGGMRRQLATRGAANPFNSLIEAAVGGKTRGRQVLTDPKADQWATMQISIDVAPGKP